MAQHPSQYAAATLPNAMAPPPAGTQRNGTLPLAAEAAPHPFDNAHTALALPHLDTLDTTLPPIEPEGGGLEGVGGGGGRHPGYEGHGGGAHGVVRQPQHQE